MAALKERASAVGTLSGAEAIFIRPTNYAVMRGIGQPGLFSANGEPYDQTEPACDTDVPCTGRSQMRRGREGDFDRDSCSVSRRIVESLLRKVHARGSAPRAGYG